MLVKSVFAKSAAKSCKVVVGLRNWLTLLGQGVQFVASLIHVCYEICLCYKSVGGRSVFVEDVSCTDG